MYKHFNFFLLLTFTLVLISCSGKQNEVLEAYEEKEIIEILADISLARSATSSFPRQSADSMKTYYYGVIEDLHGMEEGGVVDLLNALSEQPELFHQYFTAVADTLRMRNEKIPRR